MQRLAMCEVLADRSLVLAKDLVLEAHGIVQHGVEAGPEIAEIPAVDLEIERFGLFDNSVQGFIGKPVRRIATADVRMHAREPGLLELPGPADRPFPQRRLEWLTPLIDGERVVRIGDGGIQADVVVGIFLAVEDLA